MHQTELIDQVSVEALERVTQLIADQLSDGMTASLIRGSEEPDDAVCKHFMVCLIATVVYSKRHLWFG
jgi:hypothetical protein